MGRAGERAVLAEGTESAGPEAGATSVCLRNSEKAQVNERKRLRSGPSYRGRQGLIPFVGYLGFWILFFYGQKPM